MTFDQLLVLRQGLEFFALMCLTAATSFLILVSRETSDDNHRNDKDEP